MKKIASVVAAGAVTALTGTAVAASSSTDAVRAVQTASKGVSHKA
jgi:hypothetical protein